MAERIARNLNVPVAYSQSAGTVAAIGTDPDNCAWTALQAMSNKVELGGALGAIIQFYNTADASATFEVLGLPRGGGDTKPVGQLLVSGTVTFDASNTLATDPVTEEAASPAWRPGYTISETSGLGLAQVKCDQSSSLGIAAWLVLNDLSHFASLVVRMTGTTTGATKIVVTLT